MKASRIMTVNVTCITPETPLPRAWEIMKQLRVRHLPVVAQGALVGILSDRDLLARGTLQEDGQLVVPGIISGAAMTMHPISCLPGTPVSTLASLMLEHRIDSLPIVGMNKELVGLVTSSDLLALLREPEQVSDVLPFSFHLRTEEEVMAPCA
jgi:acetoin utilization protein AcuB